MILLIKLRGCPMSRVKTRKDHKCHECKTKIVKGQEAFRSLLDGEAGGLQRCDLVCIACGEKCQDRLEDGVGFVGTDATAGKSATRNSKSTSSAGGPAAAKSASTEKNCRSDRGDA